MKCDTVHGRLHFKVPYNVLTYGMDRVEQGPAKALLNAPVLEQTPRPVFPLLIHEK